MAAYFLSILQRKLKLIATDLSRQQALKANLKAILQINFIGKSITSRKYNSVFHC